MNDTGDLDIYQAVADKDYERLVKIYARAAYDALSSYSPHRRRPLSYSVSSRNRFINDEAKIDEYHSPSQSFKNMLDDRLNVLKQMINGSYIYDCDPCDCEGISTMDVNLKELSMKTSPQTSMDSVSKTTNIFPGQKVPSLLHEEEEIESILHISASYLTNSRPDPSFVVHAKPKDRSNVEDSGSLSADEQQTTSLSDDPIFDGSIATSTPTHGYNADVQGGGVGTILHLACVLDSPFLLAILLSMHGDMSSRYSAFRRTVFHEVACADSFRCLQLFIDLSKEVLDRDELLPSNETTRRSSFMTDIERFKSSVVEKWSHSTLSFISTLKLIHNIARLLKVGLVSEMDASKLLIRQVPLSHSNQQAIVEALAVDNLRWKQRKNMMETNTRSLRTWVDGHGNSVLHWSAFKNSTQSLSMLLNLGIDPNIKAEVSGWTPLHDAAYSDSSQSIELLIEAGANVNKPANSGATPLCFASQENSSHAIRTLLEAGADPTIRCCGGNQSENHHENMPITRFSGYTALHYAAHYNSEKAAKILLEYSAAYKCNLLEIPDLNDKLPIHVAVQRGSSDVLRELLHAGARVQTIEFSSQVANDITTGSRRGSPTYRSPPSSPLLRSMIPTRPVSSTKAWNCVSQRSIDECRILINEVEGNWSPSRHPLFYPSDREAVLELLRVGKHLEQRGTGIFLDLWPLVLSFCGRGWFDPSSNGSRTTQENDSNEQESNELNNFQL